MKRALVTGGTHGIGLAIAEALAKEGHTVVAPSRHTEPGFDATAPHTIDLFMRHGADFDILVNSVGGGGRWGQYEIEATDGNVWQEVYQKNAGAATQFTLSCLPHMVKAGFGRVICITSIYADRGAPRPWFGMAKAAQVALMSSLAKRPEYVRRGITFNCVAPGHIDVDNYWVGVPHQLINPDDIPLGRLGTPQEVAAVVAFLCSPEASLVNGSNIIVDGGESA